MNESVSWWTINVAGMCVFVFAFAGLVLGFIGAWGFPSFIHAAVICLVLQAASVVTVFLGMFLDG